jgi:hypothetical protein
MLGPAANLPAQIVDIDEKSLAQSADGPGRTVVRDLLWD